MPSLAAAAVALPMVLSSVPALAGDTTLGPLTVSDPWARASAGMARAGAAFMTIRNDGATDRLVAADADVSAVVELHTHIKDGDVMRMRKVEAIDFTGGTETVLQPGGLHVMLIELHAPLKEGETFPLSLTFESAGTVEVTVTVQGVGAMGGQMGGGHMGGGLSHGTTN
ncbi:copper chaperone PCu(A)C [Roseospira navarrensis]|uniref:Copper chaperone PCu(A)C n=2 Tax=Roseospira navarrensis TaxID=140058 RepID=A0A7X1ZH25_9PROT|nr:copper chaperone PCu(A)C [Roseospira navarrensis]